MFVIGVVVFDCLFAVRVKSQIIGYVQLPDKYQFRQFYQKSIMDVCRCYWMSLDLMKVSWLHCENATCLWLLVTCSLRVEVRLSTLTVPLLCRMVRKLILILIFIMIMLKWRSTFHWTTSSRMENCTLVACTRTCSRRHTAQHQSTARVSTNLVMDCSTVASRCTVLCLCQPEFDTTSLCGWGVQWQEISCVRCVRENQT